jgi:hypothetical protein
MWTATQHVHRVVSAKVDSDQADGADQADGHAVGQHPAATAGRHPSEAKGSETVEDSCAQGMPGREVGDVIEADPLHVEESVAKRGQADLGDRGEVFQRPLDREGERARRHHHREVAAAARQGEDPAGGEGERNEPAGAEPADADQERVDRRDDLGDPRMQGRHDVRHQPLFGDGVIGGALEGDEPEEARQHDQGQKEGERGAGDGAAGALPGIRTRARGDRWVRESSHAA